MENKNQGLDSIERRRALTTILKIPPFLLGLGSLDLIVEITTGQDRNPFQQSRTQRSAIGRDTLRLYQDTLGIYKKLYAEGLSHASVQDIEKWVKRIEIDTKSADTANKKELLRALWNYEILCAKIYGNDLCNWNRVFEHIDNAREIATTLDDRDLQATSLCHSGIFRLRQGRPGLAKMDIEGALIYAKGALPQTRGIIHSKQACVYADDTSLAGLTLVQSAFEQAEKYIDAKCEIKNISFGKDDYLLDRVYTLMAFDRPAKAIELLDDAEKYIDPAKKRHLIFLDISRAKCYIESKKPIYEQAVSLLKGAIEDSKEIKVARNIDQIERLCTRLKKSIYGQSPDVIDLGLALRDVRSPKNLL